MDGKRGPITRGCARAGAVLALCYWLAGADAQAAIRFDTPMLSQVAGSSSTAWPAKLAIGDLDLDGRPDVVVRCPNNQGIQLMFGRGDGSLDPPYILTASGNVTGVSIGDFDQDGFPDVVCAGQDQAVDVFFGDGTGRQWDRHTFPLETGLACTVGDFDGDGRLDFTVLSYSYPVYMTYLRTFLSRPGRTFDLVTTTSDSLAGLPWVVKAADLNHDGHLDLVISKVYANPALVVALGRGDGTFTVRAVEGWGWGPDGGLDVADLDGDGSLDIAFARGDGIAFYPGLGDGTFGVPRLLTVDGQSLGVLVGDFTGDGIPDLLRTESDQGLLEVRPGLGNWSFGPPRTTYIDRALLPVEMADMNGDERPDLVGLDVSTSDYWGLFVALGDGQGGFGPRPYRLPVTPNSTSSVAAADFNGDGRMDLLVATNGPDSTRVAIFTGGPGRTWSPGPAVTLPNWVDAVYAADIDGDGRLDAVASLSYAWTVWLRGNGDGTLEPATAIPMDGWNLMKVQDATGDGRPDLLYTCDTGIRVLPSLGGGLFGPLLDPGIRYRVLLPDQIAIGDVNGDTFLDIVTCGSGSQEGSYGTGSGWESGLLGPSLDADLSLISVAIGDVNGDGRADLLFVDDRQLCYTCKPMADQLGVALQQPDGTMPVASLLPWPVNGYAVLSLADVNGDGLTDIVYRSLKGFGVALGDGAGGFSIENGYDGTGGDMDVRPQVLDLDGDGRLDFLNTNLWGVNIAYGRDPVPPQVALTAPTPVLAIGAGTRLSWSASDNVGIHDAEAFVSRHGLQGPFRSIGRVGSEAGALDWTVTGPPSDSVAFKVVVRDSAGNVAWDRSRALVSIAQLATGVPGTASLPKRLALHLAGPNPVHSRLALRLELPQAGQVRLALYDLQGRRAASLLDESRPAGVFAQEFDLSSRAAGLRAGLYFLRFESSRERAVARVALLP